MKSRRTFLKLFASSPLVAVCGVSHPIKTLFPTREAILSSRNYNGTEWGTIKGTFAVSGATPASTAQALVDLIHDLRAKGLIGA